MAIPAEVNRGFGFHPSSDLKSAMTAGTISNRGNCQVFMHNTIAVEVTVS